MLTVQGHRRHHLTSPSHFSSTHYLDSLPLSTNPTSPSALNEKLLRSYLAGSTEDLVDAFSFDSEAFMTGAFAYSNPAIRIQQSTPVPQLPVDYDQQSSMIATSAGATERNWNMFGGSTIVGNPSLQVQYNNRRAHPHQRASSSSSIGSTTSAPHYPSQTSATADFSYSGITDTSPPASSVNQVESSYSTADQPAGHFSNHLPTPSQTPTSESFLNPTTYQNFAPQGSTYGNAMAAHYAMKQAMMDADEEVPGYAHSSRQSVSSYGNNSPATPRTVVGDDFEEKYKASNGETFFSDKVESWMDEYLRFDDEPDMMSTDIPKMEGANSEAFQAIYGQPALARIHTQHSSQHAKNSLLSPYRSVMAERLQAAQIARSQSPTSSVSRGVSPFRNGSPLAPVNNSFGSPRQRFGAAHQQANEAAVKAFAMKPMQPSQSESKTISPKDALLEFNENEEESKMPLFPPDDAQKYGHHQYSNGNVFQNFDTSSEQSYGSMATSRADSWVDSQPFASNYATAADNNHSFNFVPPSIPGSLSINNGISFSSQQYRPTSVPTAQDSTPEFPAHLTSMDSSASEAGGPLDSTDSIHDLKKPGPSTASTGTYSCTYHGCPLRFETPQKLQKHKREGHRQNPPAPVTTGVGSGMSAAELLARNSQAGPHKCERINPTTGKPCNTIFSRPYDLTRHEDTIHNARKQKVRCALCVEEKTFSRNDALTRHMRVVHPEVDFPGKHRRRGHSHD